MSSYTTIQEKLAQKYSQQVRSKFSEMVDSRDVPKVIEEAVREVWDVAWRQGALAERLRCIGLCEYQFRKIEKESRGGDPQERAEALAAITELKVCADRIQRVIDKDSTESGHR